MSSECLYWLLADSLSVVMRHVYIYTRQTGFMGENAAGPVEVNTTVLQLTVNLNPVFKRAFFLCQFTGAGTFWRRLKFQSANQ